MKGVWRDVIGRSQAPAVQQAITCGLLNWCARYPALEFNKGHQVFPAFFPIPCFDTTDFLRSCSAS